MWGSTLLFYAAICAQQLGPTDSPQHVVDDTATSQPGTLSTDAAASQTADFELESCLPALLGKRYQDAEQCYHRHAQAASQPGQLQAASTLLQLSRDLDAATTAPVAPSHDLDSMQNAMDNGNFVADGKLELILWSGIYGGWLGGVTTTWLAATGGAFIGSLLLVPLGIVAGVGASAIGTIKFEQMSAGDASLIRTSLWMGMLNAIAGSISLYSYNRQSNVLGTLDSHAIPATLLGTSLLVPALGTVAAVFTDYSDGGVAMATSAAAYAAFLTWCGLAMAGYPFSGFEPFLLMTAAADVAYLGLLVASPWIPVTRLDTWVMDLGAAMGFASAAFLALSLPAPNPVIGYGSMALGAIGGGALGLSLSMLGRSLLGDLATFELPDIVAVAPVLTPPRFARDTAIVGVQFATQW